MATRLRAAAGRADCLELGKDLVDGESDLFDEQGAHRIEIAPGQLGLLAEMA